MDEENQTQTSPLRSVSPTQPSSLGKMQLLESSSSPTPLPSSVLRLWRPAAQRNLRNQWSKLVSCKQDWVSASSSGRINATALVNVFLSRRYMASMELGVLKDFPDIRPKACQKLSKHLELYQSKLLSSYVSLVAVVGQSVNACESMRCYMKQNSNSPIVQFSNTPVDKNDSGDGAGIPVFTFLSIPFSENLAQELVEMFQLELCLKRFIVMELLAVGCEEKEYLTFSWSDELYSGEFDDLALCHLYNAEIGEISSTGLMGRHFDVPSRQNSKLNNTTLQAYLTTWFTEVNIDSHSSVVVFVNRVDEILALVGDDMRMSFR